MAKYGWYSQKMRDSINVLNQRSILGNIFSPAGVYETPDGRCVLVTAITESEIESGLAWDDVVFVGPVTKQIESLDK